MVKYIRKFVQFLIALITNANFSGFFTGKIYQGPLKQFCVPGLNCYSCPGALGACPVGALQAVINNIEYRFSLYVSGFLIIIGTVFGRFVCGFACPFGLIQELLHMIPSRKIGKNKVFTKLSYLKYLVLAFFVIIIPMILLEINGFSDPVFCKFICPAGTLEAGIPLVLLNDSLKSSIGGLFWWKMFLLILTVIASILIYRPFCRFLCPLGAIYALFNGISLFGIRKDRAQCNGCKTCDKSCKMEAVPSHNPNSPECIRCGACVSHCPKKALCFGRR